MLHYYMFTLSTLRLIWQKEFEINSYIKSADNNNNENAKNIITEYNH